MYTGRANEKSIVVFKKARFTILTDCIIRMEYSENEQFEDRPSQGFVYRLQPVVDFDIRIEGDTITIETKGLLLTYDSNIGKEFNKRNLKIIIKKMGDKEWRLGQSTWDNLGGTIRTLDNVDGRANMGEGLISKDGWSLVDDSNSLLYGEDNILKNRIANRTDYYFFGYGHEYKNCIRDFYEISGHSPLVPRYVLGNWWSRYWHYTQEELLELITTFKDKNIPLSICIVDMDWHVVSNEYSSGWTGYTWNKDLFPNHKQFLDELHKLGLKTALNLHPADGVQPHEEDYEKMALAMGIDPETKEPVYFDCSDKKFMEAYFEVLHHPKEKEGIDFWWVDWQQGSVSKIEGLDPLWALNEAHFNDLCRDKTKRSFIFSRYAGYGNQRYPIGFSGDSIVSWNSLKFQPCFTATAANVGYSWWSHDIGGHMGGVENNELYLRWVQYGVFSPILRLHSSKNSFIERRPWMLRKDISEYMKQALTLRHQLIPYIYTMARKNEVEGIPFIYPLYYDYPENPEAYMFEEEYFYGEQLIAAPIVSKMDEDLNLAHNTAWIPAGIWYNFFNGYKYEGNTYAENYCTLNEIPVFAKAGAIIPMDNYEGYKEIDNPSELLLKVFLGADNEFELYEDDGISAKYLEKEYYTTNIVQQYSAEKTVITVDKMNLHNMKEGFDRAIILQLFGVAEKASITVYLNTEKINVEQKYDSNTHIMTLSAISKKTEDIIRVEIENNDVANIKNNITARLKELLEILPINSWLKCGILEGYEKKDKYHTDTAVVENKMLSTQYKAICDIINQG